MMGFVGDLPGDARPRGRDPLPLPRAVGRHQRHDRQAVQQRNDQAEEDPRLPQPRVPHRVEDDRQPDVGEVGAERPLDEHPRFGGAEPEGAGGQPGEQKGRKRGGVSAGHEGAVERLPEIGGPDLVEEQRGEQDVVDEGVRRVDETAVEEPVAAQDDPRGHHEENGDDRLQDVQRCPPFFLLRGYPGGAKLVSGCPPLFPLRGYPGGAKLVPGRPPFFLLRGYPTVAKLGVGRGAPRR